MYNPNMDNTFIKKGDNMELIELNQAIEEAKASYEMAKTEKKAQYYKTIIQELRTEKQENIRNEFKRN